MQVLRDPYIAGVERFEAPFSTSGWSDGPVRRKEQAARFCLLLWQQFQPELRTIRYTINCNHLSDMTVEFTGQPRYDDLLNLDANDAQQIDIEVISQQPAPTRRDQPPGFARKDEHFPAFLEVFIPLNHHHSLPGAAFPEPRTEDRLVIWCRPNLLPKVTALWERAAILLLDQSESPGRR